MSNLISRKLKSILVLAIFAAVLIPVQLNAAPSFVGNVLGSSTPSDFADYWNQVTSENAAKWGSVESSRDSMNWSTVQSHYDYAKGKGWPYKYHCFVWGQQQPGWMSSLSGSEQRAEVQEYIQAAAQKFSGTSMWDVVNEPLHAKPDYRSGLGGDGSTGWDWVITVFEMANQYCGGTLLINEYGVENDSSACSQYVTIINLLKNRGLIDGVGIQTHCFNLNDTAASTLRSNLDTIANTGLPVYASEFDLQGDDAQQLARYREKFPIYYEHSSVKGITLWGYIVGQTWRDGTGLVNSGGSQRPAMQWLMSYIKGGPTSPPTSTTTSSGGSTTTSSGGSTTTSSGSGNITVRARGTKGGEKLEVRANGTAVASFTMSTSYADYKANGSGQIRVAFTNDDQQSNGMDIQVDYVAIDGTTYQAENQATNTGVYQNSQCGGSNSEWLHCNGYIEINTGSATPGPTNPPTTTTSSGGSTTTSSGGSTTTSSGGSGTCSPATSKTVPFTQDGSGEYCFSTSSNINYLNSWNMATLTVNGVNFANKWTGGSSLPAKIDGKYYIVYKGNYGWSHFEAR